MRNGKYAIKLAKVAPAPIATKIAGNAQHISVEVEANNEKKLAVLSCIKKPYQIFITVKSIAF